MNILKKYYIIQMIIMIWMMIKMLNEKQSLNEILKNLKWHEDIEYAYTDEGKDKAVIYYTCYNGYYLKIFPVSLIDLNENGWEYEIINDKKEIQYNSLQNSNGNDHAITLGQVKKWAINRLKDFLKVEGD